MLNRFFNMALEVVIERFLKSRIRRGSIQAVKAYIQVVRGLRIGLAGLFGVGMVSALLVGGIMMVIVGIIGLLPITPTAMAVTILVLGLIFALVPGIGLMIAFSEKRWMRVSKSYELMDAALAPWPGFMPPNPADVMAGRFRAPPATRESVKPVSVTADEVARGTEREGVPRLGDLPNARLATPLVP